MYYCSDGLRYEKLCEGYGGSATRRLITGKITGSNNCVGYCQYNRHPGFLTRELRKQHNCLGKSCDYYVAKNA